MTKPRERPMVQVAGIRGLQEAVMLAQCGCTHLGFPLGPGVVEEDLPPDAAARVVQGLEQALGSRCPVCVAITYLADPEAIAALLDAAGMRAVQLHGHILPERVAELRALRPGLLLFKSLVVGRDAGLLETARAYAPYVDAFLTDTHDPVTGADGATGRTHDWSISRALVCSGPTPVILAGGLGPENVAEAIRRVQPAGVDAHTGLEDAAGRKDPDKVRRFVQTALLLLPNASE